MNEMMELMHQLLPVSYTHLEGSHRHDSDRLHKGRSGRTSE